MEDHEEIVEKRIFTVRVVETKDVSLYALSREVARKILQQKWIPAGATFNETVQSRKVVSIREWTDQETATFKKQCEKEAFWE